MGVGPQNGKDLPDGRETLLEEYVLANFTPNEQQQLSQVAENGASVAEEWLKLGIESASRLAGTFK